MNNGQCASVKDCNCQGVESFWEKPTEKLECYPLCIQHQKKESKE